MSREKLSEAVRRVVYMRANGRCEYGSCGRFIARYREDGSIAADGEFCHILPVGDFGPRAEFKKQFNIDVDSPANVILLCREHHRLVDREGVAGHSPAILFEMVRRKHDYVGHAVDELYVSNPFSFDLERLAEDVRVGRIFDLLNEARLVGPRRGRESIRQAEVLLREIVRNPFVDIPEDFAELVGLELMVNGLINTYSPNQWQTALKHSEKSLRKISEKKKMAAAVLLLGIFVRDEYGIFSDQDRLRYLKILLDRLDEAIPSEQEPGFVSFLLGLKAGLLRWRGRIQRSSAQQNSFAEAERCATRSISVRRTSAGLLQLCLIQFAQARTLPLAEVEKYDKRMDEIISVLTSDELTNFGAATKYKSRFFRDIYQYDRAIEHFWIGVESGHLAELSRTAFILGECATSKFSFTSPKDPTILYQAEQFLNKAIQAGYDHERNFMSWIACRSLADPDWFKEHVVARFQTDAELISLIRVLHSESVRYFGPECFNQDALFGVDEAEFWNLLGRLCRTAVGDPDIALKYYDRAERHAGRAGGNFTTKVGKVRAYVQKSQVTEATRYLDMARNTARAFQAHIINSLELEVKRLLNPTPAA